MTGLERRAGGAQNVERHVQDLISTLAHEGIPRPVEVEAPVPATRGPRESSMVIIPFDQHADHQTLWTDEAGQDDVELRLIEHSLVASSPLIRARMGTQDATVSMLEQLGTLDDQPLFVRVSYHLASDFSAISQAWRDKGIDMMTVGTAEAFRVHFHSLLGHVQSSVEAVRSDNRTATSLRVSIGTPMMLREMVLTGVDGVVRELSFTHFRADRVALQDD